MVGFLKDIAKSMMIVLQDYNPELATKILFRKYLGYSLDMNNPITLNQKMQWLKLRVYRDNALVNQCADKYRVREFVKNKGREDLLVQLLGVWDNPSQIDFDTLPEKFVLKCNHGSGSVIICQDKTKIDQEFVRLQLANWMKEDYGLQRAELSYKNMDKKIICEELIETEDGKAPKDYKIFCNYGVPRFLFVASERHGAEASFDFYDLEWNHIPVTNCHPNAIKDNIKPVMFEKMLEAASDISKEFPIVRVDLYCENNRVYFGELTFLHFGGLHPFTPKEYDKIFGNMFNIESLLKNL